jgi:uncharacterized protein YybS (DUF2232 family)
VLNVDQGERTEPAEVRTQPAGKSKPPIVDALALAEGGLLADVAVIVELVRIFLPYVGVALAPLVPVPFALLMLRRGFRATALSVMAASLLIGLMSGLHYGWRMALTGLVGLALGWAMQIRMRPALVMLLGTALTSLAAYIFFFASVWVLGLPVADLVQQMQNSSHTANSAAAQVCGALGLDSFWKQVSSPLLAFETWMVHYWPLVLYLLLLCWSIAAVMLYYMVANRLIRWFGFEVRPFPSPRFERRVRNVLGLFRFLRPRRRRAAASPA